MLDPLSLGAMLAKLFGPSVSKQVLTWAKGSEAKQLVKALKDRHPAAKGILTQPEALGELWLYAETGEFNREAMVKALRPLAGSDDEAEKLAEAIRTTQWRAMRDDRRSHFEFVRLEKELREEMRAEVRAGTTEVLERLEAARHDLAKRLPIARQLPAQTDPFTDRKKDLAEAERLLQKAPCGHVAAVLNCCGMPGIGKSAFALELAYRLEERFTGGILHIDLRAKDGTPRNAGEVAGRLLRDLGIAPDAIPANSDERLGLLRSTLANEPVLLVLDNASDGIGVADLIPAMRESMVLVTSSAPLAELGAARLVELEGLEPHDAGDLLVAVAGDRVDWDSRAVSEIVARCEGLPLALAVIGGIARQQPWLTPDELATRVGRERKLRVTLASAIQSTSAEARRLLLLLAALDTIEVEPQLSGAIADVDEEQAKVLLDELGLSRLLMPLEGRRWKIHGQLRGVAASIGREELGDEAIASAQQRRVDWLAKAAREHAGDLNGGA